MFLTRAQAQCAAMSLCTGPMPCVHHLFPRCHTWRIIIYNNNAAAAAAADDDDDDDDDANAK